MGQKHKTSLKRELENNWKQLVKRMFAATGYTEMQTPLSLLHFQILEFLRALSLSSFSDLYNLSSGLSHSYTFKSPNVSRRTKGFLVLRIAEK